MNDMENLMNSMSMMRTFIEENGLDIKKGGPGRTKEDIFAEIKETDVYKRLIKESTDDMSSSLPKMRAFIDEHGLNIKKSGPGRTKDVIFAEIKETDAYKSLAKKNNTTEKDDSDMSSMAKMRAFIDEHGLNIKKSGLGRTKEVIYAEIQESDAYKELNKVQDFTESTPWGEINAFIKERGFDIKTRGKGRTKAVILKELEDAQKKDKGVPAASAA
jgi:hypothetical protein